MPLPTSVGLTGDRQKAAALVKRMFPGRSPQQVAAAAGMTLPSLRVNLFHAGDNTLGVVGYGKGDTHLVRYFTEDVDANGNPTGSVVLKHESQWIDGEPKGQAHQRFAEQLQHLDTLGKVKRIDIPLAAGNADLNRSRYPESQVIGYTLWPKMGFNAPLADSHLDALSPEVRNTMQGKPQDLHTLHSTPQGEKEWQDKGQSVSDLSFDLSPDSEHRQRFQKYYDRKERTAAGQTDGTGATVGSGASVETGGQGTGQKYFAADRDFAQRTAAVGGDFRLKYAQDKKSCVFLPIEGDLKERVLALGKCIPEHLLAEGGRETEPHITLLYGLETTDPAPVADLFATIQIPLSFGLIRPDYFCGDEYDVVFLSVNSKSAVAANVLLSQLPHSCDYPDYVPHCTLAYVKSGWGETVVAALDWKDSTFYNTNSVVFSNPDREQTLIRFAEEEPELTIAQAMGFVGKTKTTPSPTKYNLSPSAEILKGGRWDGKKRFPSQAVRKGTATEMEHTLSSALAAEIAKDHLTEDENYYDKLQLVEGVSLNRLRKLLQKRKPVKYASADRLNRLRAAADQIGFVDFDPTKAQGAVAHWDTHTIGQSLSPEEHRQLDAQADDPNGPTKDELLTAFHQAHPERFAGTVHPNHWGKTAKGKAKILLPTSVGDFVAEVQPMANGVHHFAFSDAQGDTGLTGGGGAHEIFGKVVPALKAYVDKYQPQRLEFTASEPNRRKFYDALVHHYHSLFDGYRLESEDSPEWRTYRMVRKEPAAKYAAEGEVVAHPSVRGFQLEHALRKLHTDPTVPTALNELAHTLLTKGVDRADAAYGIHDEVEGLPDDHWAKQARYNWAAIPHKLYLDEAVGNLISSVVGDKKGDGGLFSHYINPTFAVNLVRQTIGRSPEEFYESIPYLKAAEGLQLLKEQGHSDQDIQDSLTRHSRRIDRGINRSSDRDTLEKQQADAVSPKGSEHATDRYGLKYKTEPVYIKPEQGRYRFDNLRQVAAERAPHTVIVGGDEAKELHLSPELNPQLTPEQVKHIETFKGSSAVNRYNRDRYDFGGHRPDLEAVSSTLDHLLAAQTPTKKPLSLFRVVSHKGFPDQFEVGAVYSDKAHMSTSLDADYSAEALGADLPGNAFLHIRLPEGSKAVSLGTQGGYFDKEREVLLPRNAKFKVVSVEPLGKGKYIVLDHIPETADAEKYAAKGENPEGGLTQEEARKQGVHPGSRTAAEAKKAGGFSKIKGKTAKRRKSFCSRMCGTAKQHPKAAKDPDSRLRASLRIWGCRCGATKNSAEEEAVKYRSPALSDFIQAVRQVRSANQEARRKVAKDQYKRLGLKALVRDAIADAPQTASVNTAHSVDHNGDLDRVRAAVALYGLQTNSPQMLLFHEHADGTDFLHKFDATGSGEKLRQRLSEGGIDNRVLLPTDSGWSVMLFDPAGKDTDRIRDFAKSNGFQLESSKGTGERIGDGLAAEAGEDQRADYRSLIRKWEKQQGTL